MTIEMTKRNGSYEEAGLTKDVDAPQSWASAPVDILEGDEAYMVFADIPGVSKEDVNIEYADGELRLFAKRDVSDSDAWPSQYRRSFTIGQKIDVERITAELQRGVLRVHLPKSESAKPRQIAVNAA